MFFLAIYYGNQSNISVNICHFIKIYDTDNVKSGLINFKIPSQRQHYLTEKNTTLRQHTKRTASCQSQWIPVRDKGLVLLSCRAFIACCCFSSAASMSPRSSSTELLLFFPAALVNASYQVQEKEDLSRERKREREITSRCSGFELIPAISFVPCWFQNTPVQ